MKKAQVNTLLNNNSVLLKIWFKKTLRKGKRKSSNKQTLELDYLVLKTRSISFKSKAVEVNKYHKQSNYLNNHIVMRS